MERILHFIDVSDPHRKTNARPTLLADAIAQAKNLNPCWDIKVWAHGESDADFSLQQYWPNANSAEQLADLLRLDILLKFGGICVATDMRLLRPLDPLSEKLDFFIASENGQTLTTALIGARKEHSAVRALIEELLCYEPDWSLPSDRTTGSAFIGRMLNWQANIAVLPRETFYPRSRHGAASDNHFRRSYAERIVPVSGRNGISAKRTSWPSSVKGLVKTAVKAGLQVLHRLAPPSSAFYAAADELVVRTVHGFDIVVDGKDTSLTPHLVFGGSYELREQKFIQQILAGGDWAVDVGANVGSFTLLAAKCVGRFGRVFAYEPNPKTAKLLSKSVVLNWMHDRIAIRSVAAGDITGTVHLSFFPERLGDAMVDQQRVENSVFSETASSLGEQNMLTVEVPCVTLDSEFPLDLHIKLLKIDAEGHEGAVLRGARCLLDCQCVDFLLIEVFREVAGSRWGALLAELNRLIELGYVPCTLTPEGILVEHKSLASALIQEQDRNLVMVAQAARHAIQA